MEPSRIFKVKTKNVCFLCFRTVQGKPDDKSKPEANLRILKFLPVLKFLKVDFTTVDNLFQGFLEGVQNNETEFKVPLCHVCLKAVSKFVDLMKQLKSIQTQISASAVELKTLMQNQEIDENYPIYLGKIDREDPGDQLNQRIFETLRRETLDKLKPALVAENIQAVALMSTNGSNQAITDEARTPALTNVTLTPSDSSQVDNNARSEPTPSTSRSTPVIPSPVAKDKLKGGKRTDQSATCGELRNQSNKKQKISESEAPLENKTNAGTQYDNISPVRSPESVTNLLRDLKS